MKIARVFPRRTNATPDDPLVFFSTPPLDLPEIDAVHVSVSFSYDRERAEELAYQWGTVGVPVLVGGPAYDDPGGDFEPGLYVRKGLVMTSRGCNNRCWFCKVPKREGGIRELPIRDGWNVLDINLLQCSDHHIEQVFQMLSRQERKPEFTGGLEAKILKPWHCRRMKEIGTKRAYFAYDTPDDLEPLVEAGKMMREAGFTVQSHALACYCLIGYRGDTFERAEKRLFQAVAAGFVPYAMLYRDDQGETDPQWRKFQREWLRPQIVTTKVREVLGL